MKVLHILDYYLPVTMNWIARLIESTEDEATHYISSKYYSPEQAKLDNRFKSFGIASSYPVKTSKKLIHLFFKRAFEQQIEKFIQHENIEILHFHFGNIAIENIRLIRKFGDRSIVSLYGYDYEYLYHLKTSTKKYYQEMVSYGVQFVVEGSYSKSWLESIQIPSANIKMVHMLFPKELKKEKHFTNSKILLSQPATYTEKKGQDSFLYALASSKNKDRFLVQMHGEIADSYYYKELQKIIKLGNLKQVTLGTKISFEEYGKLLQKSNFIVNLSQRSKNNDTEGGVPMILKDALASGTPVLTTIHCDIPDWISHGYNGFINHERDISGITDSLQYIAQLSQSDYQRLCFSAIETVRLKLKAQITKNELIDLYHGRIH
ncbi:MAG: glycosyltransferase family 4 protein [Saprospiraceae bacterium]|nr:glycosyltransferase family 4 protein [Saprospiraceae bacterium]